MDDSDTDHTIRHRTARLVADYAKTTMKQLKFFIFHPGEKEAGLPHFTDTVTITSESGEWGGAPGEVEAFFKEELQFWYDGATVAEMKPEPPDTIPFPLMEGLTELQKKNLRTMWSHFS
jgi:hypothetical protein